MSVSAVPIVLRSSRPPEVVRASAQGSSAAAGDVPVSAQGSSAAAGDVLVSAPGSSAAAGDVPVPSHGSSAAAGDVPVSSPDILGPAAQGGRVLPLAAGSLAASPPAGPSAASPLLGRIEGLQSRISHFDLKVARRQAGAVMAGSMMLSGALGAACKAMLPPSVGMGVAAALALGVTSVDCFAVNHLMQGLRDKSMLFGVGVLTFFAGFALAGNVTGNPWILAAGTAAISAGCAALFSHNMDTAHNNLPQRIERAKAVVEKVATYERQHAELAARLDSGASQQP